VLLHYNLLLTKIILEYLLKSKCWYASKSNE